MREKVTIVLNEREQNKARAAEALQKSLAEAGIVSSRLPIGESIEKIVLHRAPYVLVLDYLLGDYSTGLDVLSSIQGLPTDKRPQVFFLTDEPSVPVAVESMRLGCKDYFELDHPQSIQKLVRSIQSVLTETLRSEKHATSRSNPEENFDDLIADAPSSKSAHEQLKLFAQEHVSLLLIAGPRGSGKRTLARAFSALRGANSFLRCVDLRTSTELAERICGHALHASAPHLGGTLGLTVLHGEEDDGSLLDLVASKAALWWERPNESFLTVCIDSSTSFAAWRRAVPSARALILPALKDRADDIPALVQRFLLEANALTGERLKPFDADTLRWISTQTWEGNMVQLKAATIEAALRAAQDKSLSLKVILAEQRERWDREDSASPLTHSDSTLTYAEALALCGHHYRAAAALLGCSTRSLLRHVGPKGGGLT